MKRTLLLKTVLIPVGAAFFLLVSGAIAKEIMVGQNKGKEILSQTETIMQNTAVLKAALDENLKAQKDTNDLIKKLIELQTAQQESMNKFLATADSAPAKASQKSSGGAVETATKKGSSSEVFLKLQQEMNALIRQLIEEQRWQNTLLQSSLENKVMLGKPPSAPAQ